MGLLIIGAIIAILIAWAISIQRKLVVMDENINNAMSQIGVQLSSRFDALTALLDLTKGYAEHESTTLIETIRSSRSVITATSTPKDVLKQEGVISEAVEEKAGKSGGQLHGDNTYDDAFYTILEAAAGADGVLQSAELGKYSNQNDLIARI